MELLWGTEKEHSRKTCPVEAAAFPASSSLKADLSVTTAHDVLHLRGPYRIFFSL